MKLAKFKNTVINTNYAYDTTAQVVVNRKTNKAVAWESSGKVRLTVNGERKRYTREEIVADVDVVAKKDRNSNKDTIAAQFRSKLADLVESGKSKEESYSEMNKWAEDKIKTQRDRWVYFVRSYEKVAANTSKYKL